MHRQPINTHKCPDHGPQPYVIDIAQAADQNRTFRTVIWTGRYSQTTLMCIPAGTDIGNEVHPSSDQFIYVEGGCAVVRMGPTKDRVDSQCNVTEGFAIQIPAGTWHNIVNTGHVPLKLITIYAPPLHPKGEINTTKADAVAAEMTRPHP